LNCLLTKQLDQAAQCGNSFKGLTTLGAENFRG
jgi:hypothetical protein